MTYLPFARKWRPQDFDEIIGQEHITTILKNAISMNRVHHAYLFTGPRGVGKTSAARILSKALNCETGPTPNPCNKCTSCQEISNTTSLDVMEIDGASNRGIDEMRSLREAVKFSPAKSKYKIYIIDEVHMLTTEAFNALLKTLEEPPLHVKFIFATTEPHKLLATIISRCQRFDFRRISIKDIVEKLKEVAKEEKLNVEEEVFLYIARASDGSMRDAESILDQVASFSKGEVRLKDVVASLGAIEQEVLSKCADFIINKDTKSSLYLVDEVLNSGKSATKFLSEVLEHFRNIMVAKVGVSLEDLIDLPEETIDLVKKQAKLISQGDVFYIMNIISNSFKMIKQLLPERIVLELCMIRLTSRDSISSIEEIMAKLPEISNSTHHQAPSQAHTHVPVHSQISAPAPIQAPVKPVSNAATHQKKTSVEMTRIKDAWPILVKAMAVKKMSISSYLNEGEPDSVKGDVINIAFPKELNFHREILEEKKNKDSIEIEFSRILDQSVKIQFVAVDREVKPQPPENTVINEEELKGKKHIIDSALDIFGGKLLRARGA